MRLVTFQTGAGQGRAGALVDGDRMIVDLQAAHEARYGQPSLLLSSVLAMAEAGDAALDVAADLVAASVAGGSSLVGRDGA